MICRPCREEDHDECDGVRPSYCDCHHEDHQELEAWREFIEDLELRVAPAKRVHTVDVNVKGDRL